MTGVVYDAGVLVAVDKEDRRALAKHVSRLQRGITPFVPSPVVAQVSRSPRQVQLRRFLNSCIVLPPTERDAHEAGQLLGKTRTTDVVDALVVAQSPHDDAVIITSDPKDIERLVRASGKNIAVIAL